MTRIYPESRVTLAGKDFTIVASNVGASLASIAFQEYGSLTREVPSRLEHGRQAGLFCCGQFFARTPERTLRFGGKRYALPYPDDVDPSEVDPDGLFLHGLDYLYSFEQTRLTKDSVTYVRSAERLPVEYPFPYRMEVSYEIEKNELLITVAVDEVERPTPICPTIHPFFQYYLGARTDRQIALATRCTHCFEYSSDAALPMAETAPVALENGGPFAQKVDLPADLDHSYITEHGTATLSWQNGPSIHMQDLTPSAFCPVYPLQVWTSAGTTRNVCGVEQGGPANAHGLAEDGEIPPSWRMVVEPGERRYRQVRYTFSR